MPSSKEAVQQPAPSTSRALKGRDLISIGIFAALWFAISMVFMLISGISPYIWVMLPAIDALFCATPILLLCARVQKPGALLVIGIVFGGFCFLSGSFSPYILALFVGGTIVGEAIRYITHYTNFMGNAFAYAFFSLGMCGSPLPIWTLGQSFFDQMLAQGISAEYVGQLSGIATTPTLVLMFAATLVCGVLGAYLSRALFKKHFAKAGMI